MRERPGLVSVPFTFCLQAVFALLSCLHVGMACALVVGMNTNDFRSTGKYSLRDCGCYVDGAHGIHAIDKIVAFAKDHNFDLDEDVAEYSTLSDYEFRDEVEDAATDYMNEFYSVDGAYWGRNENGDWGLWESTED